MLGKLSATALAVLGKHNFQINFRLFVILTIRKADCGLVSFCRAGTKVVLDCDA